jgi:hypothetical protein
MNKNKKPFFPKDKPKSWVIGISSGLIGLLVAGPTMFLGIYIDVNLIKVLGTIMFVLCWAAFAITWVVYALGLLSGKYRDLQEKEWSEQVW